jgi:hypothetical protein
MMSLFGLTRGGLQGYLPQYRGVVSTVSPTTGDPIQVLDRDVPRILFYQRMWDYYLGDQYTQDALQRRQREGERRGGKDVSAQLQPLYNFVRNFHNVVPRVVNAQVDSVFREPTRFQANDTALQPKLETLLRVSQMDTKRYAIVRYGAVGGDVYLRVGQDRASGYAKVFVHPPDVMRVVRDPFDRDIIDYGVMSFAYTEVAGKVEKAYVRTDLYFPDEVRTFRDGQPFGFNGNPATMPNELGHVPVTHIRNMDVGLDYGIPSFMDILPAIDVVNEFLSFLFNIVKLNADPVVLAYGVPVGGLKKGSQTDPNATKVWYIPAAREGATSRVELLEWKGNLPDVADLLNLVMEDIRDARPELHLSKLHQMGTTSGFALNAMLFQFVESITQQRVIYRAGVCESLSMGLAFQDVLDGDTAEYDPLDDRYRVNAILPPVLPLDEDGVLNRVIAKLEAGLIGKEDALKEMGVPDEQIPAILERALAEAEARMEQAQALAAARTRMQGAVDTNAQAQDGQARMSPAERAAAATDGQPLGTRLNADPTHHADRRRTRNP